VVVVGKTGVVGSVEGMIYDEMNDEVWLYDALVSVLPLTTRLLNVRTKTKTEKE
jgi:hypothetical protein